MSKYDTVSVFDLDHTILRTNASKLLFLLLHEKDDFPVPSHMTSLYYYMRHKFFGMELPTVHSIVFEKFLRNRSYRIIEKYIPEFIEEWVIREIYFPVYSKLQEAIQMGHYTAIYSNAPNFVVRPIAEYLGVHEWMGSNYEIDDEGNFTHISSFCLGEDKARRLESLMAELNIPKERIYTYSDSILDKEFLEASGNPVGVRPDAKLKALCEKNQWTMM
ncbi:MAG: putative phosphatase [Chlamydiia bacterium]|nr:putative phosphatase [Chlamydiia bacterium]